MANRLKRNRKKEAERLWKEDAANLFRESKDKQKGIEINREFKSSEHKEAWERIIGFLKKKNSKIIKDKHYLNQLFEVTRYYSNFIRNIEEICLPGKSPKTHFLKITNHLFVKYPIPAFFNNVWSFVTHTKGEWVNWYIQIAQGASPYKTSPIPMTRNQVKIFMGSPSSMTPYEAVRVAQFLDLGGEKISIPGIISTPRLCNPNINIAVAEDFRIEMMRWLSQQNMLDNHQYINICDWAFTKKFETEDEIYQPNFTMKGRTTNRILREVNDWHFRLNLYSHNANQLTKSQMKEVVWSGDPTENWYFITGEKENERKWTMNQIKNMLDLYEEGFAMSHCAISYKDSCISGKTSIWSLRCNNERKATIEIMRDGRMTQARKRFNARITPKEMSVLRRFAARKEYQMSQYVR